MELDELAQELFLCTALIKRGPMKELKPLTEGEMYVLGWLTFGCGERVTPTAISEAMNLSTARVANVLNSLERKELVRRERCSRDRRRVYLTVTEKGRALAEDGREHALEAIRAMLTALGKEDAETLVRISRRVIALIQEHEAAEAAAQSP